MSVLEIIAVFFSLLCVWLSVKRNVLNWPMGIIAVSAYMIFFYQVRLYADMVLQGFFIVQGFYGWYQWTINKGEKSTIPVTRLTRIQGLIVSSVVIAIAVVWGSLLRRYTNASVPIVDAFAATASLAANWLMAWRKIESWQLWIIADVFYIGLFLSKGLYLSFGIYLVFLALAIAGFFEWLKNLSTDTASR